MSFWKSGLPRVLRVFPIFLAGNLLAQTNGILREVYYNISGNAVSDLLNAPAYPSRPGEEFVDPTFEAPVNFADNYGQRMRALLVPPKTGSYVFWIASDDNSVLYLSPDEDPAHKVQIAAVTSWTSSRQWTTYTSQKSASISLTNGFRYYIEALQKEGSGGDNLAVTWQRPGDAAPANGSAPIPGTNMVPYGLGPPVITVQPAPVTAAEGGGALFTIQLAHYLGAGFQWQRDGADIPAATNGSYYLAPVGLGDSGRAFSCVVTNGYGRTNSAAATLTVNPDLTPPTLISVGSLGDPRILTVIFSEPVEPATATAPGNYTFDWGVTAVAAAFGADARTIVLTTTPMTPQRTYTLTVNKVRDRAATPNTILSNTQRAFTLDSIPLDISFVRPPPEPAGPSTRRGPLILSEIMYHPTHRADGRNLEFIELYNSNPFFEDISGFRISGDIDFTFPTNTIMAARSYLVLAAVPADVQAVYGITNIAGAYAGTLPNGSGLLRLRNRQDGILFEVQYSGDPPWPAAADGAGHSLVLARPSLGERNPDAWAASAVMGGSPGRADIIIANLNRTVLINEFLAHTDPPDIDYIELFNYSAQLVDLSGCVLTDDPATNKFTFPANVAIGARGFLALNQTQLGFALNAAGETIYLIDPSVPRVIDAVRFGAQENGVATGRTPDGAPGFYRLQSKTFGTANDRRRLAPVVINEIMYDPVSGEDDDQYVELYNRSGSAVDVGRWSVTDGIHYTIPLGTILPADGYLVIARNAARLLTNYPALTGANTLGDFGGRLSHGGDHIALAMPDEVVGTNAAGQVVTNTIHIVVDDVAYGTGGRWGSWSHGGGSSLERIDARADGRLAPNWADSDETGKSGWTTIQVTGVLDNGSDPANALEIILLGAGECLVDNVEVFVSGGANLVSNSDFETGLAGWVPQGNHEDTSLEVGQGYNSAQCLHVRATGHGDTGANRIRTHLKSTLNALQSATIRARVRWLRGWPEILLRLHGNWLEATGNTLTARNLGSPGARNSMVAANGGPAITAVQHYPVTPTPGQPVTVVAHVDDPDGLATLLLKYRFDPSTNLVLVPMVNNGAGLFSGTLPGQSAGSMLAFHIQATDNGSPPALAIFPSDAPARECLVRWGDPLQGGNFGTYRLWITQATLTRWSTREKLSNKPLDATFVLGNYRAVYNAGGEYSGSPWHAPGFNSPTGNVCDYVFTFPEDDVLLGETEPTLQWPGNGGGDNTYQREQTAYWIADQIGLPYCYRRHVNLFINGVRRAQMFEDVQQPNGDLVGEFWPDQADGDLHKVQLWFEFDDTATTFNAQGASLQKFTTTGGAKKLARYRWTFAKRAVHGSASNYTNLFALVDAANYSTLGINYRRQLEAVVDVDNWLGTYAVEHLVGNNDSFAYGGGQNMYSYRPDGDTWKMMIWDIDFAFSSQGPTSDMFQGIGRSCGIDLTEPGYRRRYWQILQDLANGPLVSTRVNPVLDAKYAAITANGRTIDNPSVIKTYLNQRQTYLLNLINTSFTAVFSSGSDVTSSVNQVTLFGTAPIDVRTITVNGAPYPVRWTGVTTWNITLALPAGTNTVVLQGLDARGNPLAGATTTNHVTVTATLDPPEDKLVINEIHYNPALPGTGFVEIYNSSPATGYDLSGWRLDGAGFTFPPGTVIGPGAYLVVAGDRVDLAAAYGGTIPVAGEFSGNLANEGETLRLVRPGPTPDSDQVINRVTYESRPPWPASANGAGSSLQLLDPAQDNNRVANWGAVNTNDSPAIRRATPGVANSVRATQAPFPALRLNEIVPDNRNGATDALGHHHPWVELFNGGTTPVSLDGLFLGDNYFDPARWPFPNGSHIDPGQCEVVWLDGNPGESTATEWHASFTVPPQAGSLALADTNGPTPRILDYLNYNVPQPDRSYGSWPDGDPGGRRGFFFVTPGATNNPAAQPLSVVINEWMADNTTTLADPADNDFEDWFELYNPGTEPADLAGFYFGSSLTNRFEFLIPPGYTVPAGGYLLVWADGETSQNGSNRADLHVSFKLAKSGDAIGLFGADGTIVDFVSFGAQSNNVSQGRFPNGAGDIYFMPDPTPRAANAAGQTNTAPVLAGIPNQSILEGQYVLVRVSATDPESPPQRITFSLAPGAPAGMSINPDSGLLFWRPSTAQSPGAYPVTVLAADDGQPPRTGSGSFVVRVYPPPRFGSVNSSPGGGLSLSFGTIPGRTYRVEFKDDLNDPAWSALGADVIADGDSLTVSDPAGQGPQRYYRIVILN